MISHSAKPDDSSPADGPSAAQTLQGQRLHFGGYAEIETADTQRDAPSLSLDRLSLIGSWTSPQRWSGLVELELKRALVLQPGDSGVDGARPVLERAYIDFAQSDALQLRLGKFLTPIGRWNQLHAAPLTWTTSRPLITEDGFAGFPEEFLARCDEQRPFQRVPHHRQDAAEHADRALPAGGGTDLRPAVRSGPLRDLRGRRQCR